MKINAVQGHRYKATIKLGFFEKFVSNATIIQKLLDAGLKDIKVWGDSSERYAEGTCMTNAEVELPSQIVKVEDLGLLRLVK